MPKRLPRSVKIGANTAMDDPRKMDMDDPRKVAELLAAARGTILDALDTQLRTTASTFLPAKDLSSAGSWLKKERGRTTQGSLDQLDGESATRARVASDQLLAEAKRQWLLDGVEAIVLPNPAAPALLENAGFDAPPLVIDDLICSIVASLVIEQFHTGDGALTTAEQRAGAMAISGSVCAVSWLASKKRRGPARRGARATWR